MEAVQQQNANKNFRYTFGSKVIIRNNNNNYNQAENNQPVFTSAGMRQVVSSSYFDADWKLNKITAHTGLRFDYNVNNYKLPVIINQSFATLTPTISLTYNIDKINLLLLTYGRNVYRPGLTSLSPVTTPSSAYEASAGSVNLKNQINNRWGAQYYGNYAWARIGFNFSYSRVRGLISHSSSLDSNDVIQTQSANIDRSESYTLGFSADFKFLKSFRFSHTSSYSYSLKHSGIYVNNVWGGYLSDRLNYELDKQSSFNISMTTFSPNVELQGLNQVMAYADWGVSYSRYFDFLKNYPTSISIGVSDPNLYNGLPGYSTVNTANFRKRTDDKADNAIISLSMHVQFKGKSFGNRTFNKEKSIQNTDIVN